jgi:hypothetical protein
VAEEDLIVSTDPTSSRFGPDFVEAMRTRWEGRRAVERPLTYQNAVEDEFRPWREWLDEQLAVLPESTAAKIAKRVWQDEGFWPSIMELATGAGLRALGLEVVYEQVWDGLTPDWTILADGKPSCFVEVHTDSPPSNTNGQIRAWRELGRRISDIPVSVVLVVRSTKQPPEPPTAGKAKKIAESLRKQLLQLGSSMSLHAWGYEFVVLRDGRGNPIKSPRGLRASFAPPSVIAGVVSARDVSIKVERKVSRYRALADRYDVPLIVAIGADRFTGLTLSIVDDLLKGTPTTTMQFNIGDSFIGESQLDVARPPQWAMPAGLSGLLWISNELPFKLEASRPNPKAAHPMPPVLRNIL